MKIAIMQPYFLPYAGYFQLIKNVDKFVYFNDVAFIKRGWINRNKILLNNEEYLFTLELSGASQFKQIDSVLVGSNRSKLIQTFRHAYNKAPFYEKVEPLLHLIFNLQEKNLSRYIIESNLVILNYLGIDTEILVSSEIANNKALKGQEKIVDICEKIGADEYLNSFGGQNLYSKEFFSSKGISLQFIKPILKPYPQFTNDFIPSLSIIDILMFNSIKDANEILNSFEIIYD